MTGKEKRTQLVRGGGGDADLKHCGSNQGKQLYFGVPFFGAVCELAVGARPFPSWPDAFPEKPEVAFDTIVDDARA